MDTGAWFALAASILTVGQTVHGLLMKSRDRLTALRDAQIQELQEKQQECERMHAECKHELNRARRDMIQWWEWAQRNLQRRPDAAPPPPHNWDSGV